MFDALRRLFGAKEQEPSPPPQAASETAEGWDAITAAMERLYPGQTNPPHVAPTIHRMHDLSENAAAFDGMSAYDAGGFWHYVTFGLTELYGKESDDADVSGFGYELTFRLRKDTDTPPMWPFEMLEAIGKTVWAGAHYDAGHTIRTGPIDGRSTTADALLVLEEPDLPTPLPTPHGEVRFLTLLGIPDAVREALIATAADFGPDWPAEATNRALALRPGLVTTLDPG